MAHHALEIAGIVDVELQTHGQRGEFGVTFNGHAPLLSRLGSELGIVAVENRV